MSSMHDVSDPRNASILINVNGELKPRAEAVVSVFDSGFMLGDGVWEGLRIHQGKPAFLDRHLDRLFEGAKAIAMDIGIVARRVDRAALRDTRRERHERGRACPADGYPRSSLHPLPGPARGGWQRDNRHHP